MSSMKTLMLILVLGFSQAAISNTKEELFRLQKCYGIFVSERIPSSHPLWIAVKQGTKSGTDACMDVLAKGKFLSEGKIAKDGAGKFDETGIKVLKNFLFFYKAQLKVSNFGASLNPDATRTVDIVDANEPTYHYLYSLFKENESFHKVLTRTHGLRASRYTLKPERYKTLRHPTNGLFYDPDGEPHFMQGALVSRITEDGEQYYIPTPGAPNPGIPFFPTPIETGLLVGLAPETVQNFITELPLKNLPVGHPWTNINAHYGGGVLGTQAYMMGNMTANLVMDGGVKLQRKYGENVLADMLCKGNPPLRPQDVTSEVLKTSSIAFRKGVSCMRCHSGMDPLAGVTRNLASAFTHNSSRDGQVAMVTKREITSPSSVLWAETGKLTNYTVSEPLGRLYYRSYDGTLEKNELSGITELGNVIATKNDFYVCAAKRHFQFLTGIEVSLQDLGDPDATPLTDAEKMYRERVIKLGLDLKNHQSLSTLIRKIIESPTFISPDKGI